MDPDGDRFQSIVTGALVGLAAVAAVGALVRLFGAESYAHRVDDTTLLYLAVGGALLMLQRVKSLSFGDYKVEFDALKKDTQEAKALAREATARAEVAEELSATGLSTAQPAPPHPAPPTTTSNAAPTAAAPVWTPRPGAAHDDPWKGVFGGRRQVSERILSATVQPIPGQREWFLVKLVVEPATGNSPRLGESVQFFLHPTMPNDRPIVKVDQDGKARLSLRLWGAFTVGVLCDAGQTKLELDLAELDDAPTLFKSR